jgi:4'-phosphopantetheinyl transferase
MIYVYYNRSPERLKDESFNYLLEQLPPLMQSHIMKFRKWQDRQRGLLGKSLLITGLRSLGLNSYSLKHLKHTDLQRPYFDNSIDFNISHSGEYTICAISETNRIGIDVEEIQNIPLQGFESQFSRIELDKISQAENNLHAFYTLWTQKESFLKAIGTGLYVPLNKIAIEDNKIVWEDKEWFLHEIKLDQGYVSYLSTDSFRPTVVMEEVEF